MAKSGTVEAKRLKAGRPEKKLAGRRVPPSEEVVWGRRGQQGAVLGEEHGRVRQGWGRGWTGALWIGDAPGAPQGGP